MRNMNTQSHGKQKGWHAAGVSFINEYISRYLCLMEFMVVALAVAMKEVYVGQFC